MPLSMNPFHRPQSNIQYGMLSITTGIEIAVVHAQGQLISSCPMEQSIPALMSFAGIVKTSLTGQSTPLTETADHIDGCNLSEKLMHRSISKTVD